MNGEVQLFEFMSKYYGREKIENEQDKDLMYDIHNMLFPDCKEYKMNCDSCVVSIFKKLKIHYENLNSKI